MCSFFETSSEKIHCFTDIRKKHKLQEDILSEFPLESKLILMMTEKDPVIRISIKDIKKHNVYLELKNKYKN